MRLYLSFYSQVIDWSEIVGHCLTILSHIHTFYPGLSHWSWPVFCEQVLMPRKDLIYYDGTVTYHRLVCKQSMDWFHLGVSLSEKLVFCGIAYRFNEPTPNQIMRNKVWPWQLFVLNKWKIDLKQRNYYPHAAANIPIWKSWRYRQVQTFQERSPV